MTATLHVSVWRGGAVGSLAVYDVPAQDSQTVLDVVTYIQRHLEPTLSYRFACRVGMCGSCAMTVNGRPRWTCRTHVSKVLEDGGLEIGPLGNLPVIKDLATDMSGFFEKWQEAKGAFVPTSNSSSSGTVASSEYYEGGVDYQISFNGLLAQADPPLFIATPKGGGDPSNTGVNPTFEPPPFGSPESSVYDQEKAPA